MWKRAPGKALRLTGGRKRRQVAQHQFQIYIVGARISVQLKNLGWQLAEFSETAADFKRQQRNICKLPLGKTFSGVSYGRYGTPSGFR